MDYADQYLQLARGAKTESMEAIALSYKAQAFLQSGRIEEARNIFNEAIEKLENLGSRLELARALVQRARTLRALDQESLAREDLALARVIFEDCGAVNGYNHEGESG
jgi:tetratricopeptide (TPR) repeat protein